MIRFCLRFYLLTILLFGLYFYVFSENFHSDLFNLKSPDFEHYFRLCHRNEFYLLTLMSVEIWRWQKYMQRQSQTTVQQQSFRISEWKTKSLEPNQIIINPFENSSMGIQDKFNINVCLICWQRMKHEASHTLLNEWVGACAMRLMCSVQCVRHKMYARQN